MRTREEIEKANVNVVIHGYFIGQEYRSIEIPTHTNNPLMLELLLDIRDLLQKE